MPAAPSPQRAEAKSMYLASGGKEKLQSIADQLGVSSGTLRGWKTKDRWDDELSGALHKKKRSAPKKRGAPKGNKNAVGNNGGAPPGTGNGNYKHGGYSEVYWEFLDDDERAIAESEIGDEEAQLEDQIRLLSIRERRLMLAINKYREHSEKQSIMSIISEEDKKIFKSGEEDEEERYAELRCRKQDEDFVSYFGHDAKIITTAQANIDIIKGLEETLTKVQSRKTACIKALADLRIARQKMDLVKVRMGIGENEQLERAIELLEGIDSAI